MNSAEAADSKTSKEFLVTSMNFIGLDSHQKDDQLLREGHQWQGADGGQDSGGAARPAGVGWDAGEALDGGDGSNHVYGLTLRLPSTARGSGEGGSFPDAACHCRGEEEERSHRCRQDRRLPAL